MLLKAKLFGLVFLFSFQMIVFWGSLLICFIVVGKKKIDRNINRFGEKKKEICLNSCTIWMLFVSSSSPFLVWIAIYLNVSIKFKKSIEKLFGVEPTGSACVYIKSLSFFLSFFLNVKAKKSRQRKKKQKVHVQYWAELTKCSKPHTENDERCKKIKKRKSVSIVTWSSALKSLCSAVFYFLLVLNEQPTILSLCLLFYSLLSYAQSDLKHFLIVFWLLSTLILFHLGFSLKLPH